MPGVPKEFTEHKLHVRSDVSLVLGEIRRDTRHVFGRPCEDVLILTEEIDELTLFAVKVCTYDSVPLRVLQVQGYLIFSFAGLNEP